MALLFGTGGIPWTVKKRNVVEGVNRINELDLDAMELEFVYQVFLREAQAKELKEAAEAKNVALSVHGSYFINLASTDPQKWHAGVNRIIQAAQIGSLAGARYVTFHPGFRQAKSEEALRERVEEGIEKVLGALEDKKIQIKITPELTGKGSQWGDLEELVALVKKFSSKKLGFCFDFAHKHARSNGAFNTKAEFDQMLGFIRENLGQEFLQDMHIHVSGINYSEKGERNHLTFLDSMEEYKEAGLHIEGMEEHYEEFKAKNRLDPSDLEWKALLESLKENKVEGIVVCESPNLEQDALLMKRYYESL